MTYALNYLKRAPLRHFSKEEPLGKPMRLKNPPEARTIHVARRRKPDGTTSVLKPALYNAKIGRSVKKGVWKGFPIYSLTLEERATCWNGCPQWSVCYGNKMHLAHRFEHGPDLVARLDLELAALQKKHPKGFVVRLHILGDFYSVEYVHKWADFLKRYPALHIYGYTGRQPSSDIGKAVAETRETFFFRFRIRFSGHETRTIPAFDPDAGLLCPAQTSSSENCGTCTLCWSLPFDRVISFILH
jgi:hypothetical protein